MLPLDCSFFSFTFRFGLMQSFFYLSWIIYILNSHYQPHPVVQLISFVPFVKLLNTLKKTSTLWIWENHTPFQAEGLRNLAVSVAGGADASCPLNYKSANKCSFCFVLSYSSCHFFRNLSQTVTNLKVIIVVLVWIYSFNLPCHCKI